MSDLPEVVYKWKLFTFDIVETLQIRKHVCGVPVARATFVVFWNDDRGFYAKKIYVT